MAQHLGPVAVSYGSRLVASYSTVGRTVETSFFDGIGWISLGAAVWIAGWVAQFIVGWIVWKIATCGHTEGYWTDHIVPEDHKKRDIPLTSIQINAPILQQQPQQQQPPSTIKQRITSQQQQQQPAFVQSYSGWPERQVGSDKNAVHLPSAYGRRPARLPFVPENREWHGRSSRVRAAYQNAVSTLVRCLRVVIVIFATVIAFRLCGVSFVSLATSLGLVSLTFSMAASSQISNVFAGITISGTGKVQMHDFVEVAGVIGEIEEMDTQWVVVVNRFDPTRGKTATQVSNVNVLHGNCVIFEDGPPPFLVDRMNTALKQAAATLAPSPDATTVSSSSSSSVGNTGVLPGGNPLSAILVEK